MIGLGEWGVPEAHDGVADVFIEGAVVGEDLVGHVAEVAVHEDAEFFNVHGFGHVGEVGDVGEEEGELRAGGAEDEFFGVLRELLGDGGGDDFGEGFEHEAALFVFGDVGPGEGDEGGDEEGGSGHDGGEPADGRVDEEVGCEGEEEGGDEQGGESFEGAAAGEEDAVGGGNGDEEGGEVLKEE